VAKEVGSFWLYRAFFPNAKNTVAGFEQLSKSPIGVFSHLYCALKTLARTEFR
jgi:hypothetical protein